MGGPALTADLRYHGWWHFSGIAKSEVIREGSAESGRGLQKKLTRLGLGLGCISCHKFWSWLLPPIASCKEPTRLGVSAVFVSPARRENTKTTASYVASSMHAVHLLRFELLQSCSPLVHTVQACAWKRMQMCTPMVFKSPVHYALFCLHCKIVTVIL